MNGTGWHAGWIVFASGLGVVLACAGCDREDAKKPPPAPKLSPGITQALESPPVASMPAPLNVEQEPPSESVAATQSAPASQPGVPPFRPLLMAAPGQWASYACMDERTLRYDIESATVAAVVTRIMVTDHGKPLGSPARREDLRDADLLAAQATSNRATRTCSRAQIKAAGRTWDAFLYEDRWTDEDIAYVRKTWVSSAVPVFGTIRMELYGADRLEAKLELTGFGPK